MRRNVEVIKLLMLPILAVNNGESEKNLRVGFHHGS
jgi:hypothetical protein